MISGLQTAAGNLDGLSFLYTMGIDQISGEKLCDIGLCAHSECGGWSFAWVCGIGLRLLMNEGEDASHLRGK